LVGLSFSVDVIRRINGDEAQLDRPANHRGTLETSMSVRGTSATLSRRASMSGSEPFSDISGWPAYVAE
jgi:hypothetical protein